MNDSGPKLKSRKRRIRPNYPLLLLTISIFAACLGFLIISIERQASNGYHVVHLLPPRLLELFFALWFFWVGSAIGSFLNVVAYRMPLGRSINGISACPCCGAPINLQDNVPIFGWLNLRGRCRSCHLPISARYPIVEAIVGLSVALVGICSLWSGGSNLPFQEPLWRSPVQMPQITTQSIAVNTYHIVTLSCTWAFALIRFDGKRLPRRLVHTAIAASIIPMIAWPKLQMVPWQMTTVTNWNNGSHLVAFFYTITGFAAAVVLARVIGRHVCPAADPKLDPLGKETSRLIDLILIFSIPGIVLGWHALIAIALLAIVAAIVFRRLFPQRNGFEWLVAAVPFMMAIHLALWRPLTDWTFWPAANHPPWIFLVWLTAIFVLASDLRVIPPPQMVPDATNDEVDE